MKLYIKEFYKEENVIEIGSSPDNMFYWFYQIKNNNKYFFRGTSLYQSTNWTKNEPKKYIYEEYFVDCILQLIKECKSHNFYDN